MNIVFAGTPDFAATHLSKLLSDGHQITAVYTQPDRPKGRGHQLTMSPVKEIALAHNIPVYQPQTFKANPEAIAEFKALQPDLFVVVAYGLILPQELLDIPTIACINVHGSLLPKWRGAAPIQRSLWAGDEVAGITIQTVNYKLDSGNILKQISIPITQEDTSESLYNRLAEVGTIALSDAVTNIQQLLTTAIPQDESLVTYAKKLTREEAQLNFNLDAKTLERYIRAYQPWPIAYFTLDNLNIKVYQAEVITTQANAPVGTIVQADKQGLAIATSDGILRITVMQMPGKKAMKVADILNSRKDTFSVGRVITYQAVSA